MGNELKDLKIKADKTPNNVTLQIKAAYALDSSGDEQGAIKYYDRAYQLGIPLEEQPDFLLCYGSTLKNVERLKESEQILKFAISENPNNHALPVFLALTYHAQGKSSLAISELIKLILVCGEKDVKLKVYSRALSSYASELEKESC